MSFNLLDFMILVPTALVIIVFQPVQILHKLPWRDTSIYKYSQYDYMGRRRY